MEGPKSGALRYLQSIYNDPCEAKSLRLKAAIEALPYETPKLSAIANFDAKEFAIALEQTIKRSRAALVGRGEAVEVEPVLERENGRR
jgi:hypothetical protein